jgi:hypothetical protein
MAYQLAHQDDLQRFDIDRGQRTTAGIGHDQALALGHQALGASIERQRDRRHGLR